MIFIINRKAENKKLNIFLKAWLMTLLIISIQLNIKL